MDELKPIEEERWMKRESKSDGGMKRGDVICWVAQNMSRKFRNIIAKIDEKGAVWKISHSKSMEKTGGMDRGIKKREKWVEYSTENNSVNVIYKTYGTKWEQSWCVKWFEL